MKISLWKVTLGIVSLIIVIGICLIVFFYDYDKLSPDHPKGKEMYYTMISGKGIEGENGRYNYQVTAYGEDLKKKEIKFSASKQLTEGAYLQLYHTKFRGITYWEEVSYDELPSKVKQKYPKESKDD